MSKYLKATRSALFALASIGASSMINAPAQATCGPEQFIGSICFTAANFCPREYAPAYGQMVAIADNTVLYAVIGCRFGGNCTTTMKLPNLRGRVPIGTGQGPGLSRIILAEYRGLEDRVLTEDQLAEHSQTATFTPTGGGSGSSVTVDTKIMVNDADRASAKPDATNKFLGASHRAGFGETPPLLYNNGSSGTLVELGGVTSTATGGGGGITGGVVTVGQTGENIPIETFDPSLGLTPCIANDGLYPPRP